MGCGGVRGGWESVARYCDLWTVWKLGDQAAGRDRQRGAEQRSTVRGTRAKQQAGETWKHSSGILGTMRGGENGFPG